MAIGITTKNTKKTGPRAAGGIQQNKGRQGNSALAQGPRLLMRKAGKSRREGLSA